MLAPKFSSLTATEKDSLCALVRDPSGDLSVRKVQLWDGRYTIRWDRVLHMPSYQSTIDSVPCDVPECYLGTEQQMLEAQQSVASDMTKALSVPEIAAHAVVTAAAVEFQEAGQLSRAGAAAAMLPARPASAAAAAAAGDELLSESGGRCEVDMLQATHKQLQQFSLDCRQQAEDMCRALGMTPAANMLYELPTKAQKVEQYVTADMLLVHDLGLVWDKIHDKVWLPSLQLAFGAKGAELAVLPWRELQEKLKRTGSGRGRLHQQLQQACEPTWCNGAAKLQVGGLVARW